VTTAEGIAATPRSIERTCVTPRRGDSTLRYKYPRLAGRLKFFAFSAFQARQWDRDHDQHVFQKVLALVQPDLKPASWRAFTRFAIDGLPAAAVARELEMSESAVMQAKFRVFKRLREKAGDLLD